MAVYKCGNLWESDDDYDAGDDDGNDDDADDDGGDQKVSGSQIG